MIKPIGSDELQPRFVYNSSEHDKLSAEAESLPSVVISSQAAGNAVMMGGGYFSPLQGFMNVADAMGAAEKMTLTDGSFFPVPVLCLLESVDAIKDAKRIALRDPNVDGNPVLAIMDIEAIEEVSAAQMKTMTQKVYRTEDPEHVGVAAFNSQGRIAVSGPIQVLNFSYLITEFPEVKKATRLYRELEEPYVVIKYEEKNFNETHFFYADANFFEVFSFPLLKGNSDTALSQPNSIVITQSASKKYFGNEDSVGKTHLQWESSTC